VAWLGQQLEGLGYSSWAYRVVNTASAPRAFRGSALLTSGA